MLDKIKRPKEHWFEWFHLIYASITIVAAFMTILGERNTVKEVTFLILFGVYFLILLIFQIFSTYTYSKTTRYAEAYNYLHEAIHLARNAYHYLEQCYSPEQPQTHFEKELFREYMISVLSAASAAFSLVTGVRCRTSIKVLGYKVLENHEKELFISTLARDRVSMDRHGYRDRNEGSRHSVQYNDDFSFIMGNRAHHFFSNNLKKISNYFNTSIAHKVYDRQDWIVEDWCLPYVSTIVWPIRYLSRGDEYQESSQENNHNDQDIYYGFLTVDSAYKNVFNKQYDTEMGAALADAIFSVLDMYDKVKKKMEEERS